MNPTKENLNASYLSSNFKECFGDMTFTSQETKPEFITLPKYMNDDEILKEYSPNHATLGELSYLLKNNVLDKDGWYIFYVEDQTAVLRAVCVRWFGDGWSVGAGSVECPFGWGDGGQVFSRNSLKSSDSSASMTLSPSDSLTLEKAIEMVKKEGYKIYKEI
jgi:hypothetical protein